MVGIIAKLGRKENRMVEKVKERYGLKNKSDTINFLLKRYKEEFLEDDLMKFIQEAQKPAMKKLWDNKKDEKIWQNERKG